MLVICLFAYPVFAQPEHTGHNMPEDKTESSQETHTGMTGMYGDYPMTRESSGTSWQPDSTPAQGLHFMRNDWMLMADGFVNGIYDRQGGHRGDEQVFSASMFMFMAQRPFSDGTLGFRSMLSLDPAMGKKGYPLLLQTGETADGITPLTDRQHPHDLFMELAAVYSKPVSRDSSVFIYLGLPGEPALGPPAFMHRFSAMDAPAAPITHHWLDATHITYGVSTIGFIRKNIKIEGSVFRGREPDQNRWDIEAPDFDSVSGRLSFNPTADLSMQVSAGRIKSPEQLEPDVDVKRGTASVTYNRSFRQSNWQTSLAWGRNDNVPGKVLDGFLIESALNIDDTHSFFTRFERVAKDELFPAGDALDNEEFTVSKISAGYIYEPAAYGHGKWGLGGSFDVNILPDKLKRSYGDASGFMVFVRVRLN